MEDGWELLQAVSHTMTVHAEQAKSCHRADRQDIKGTTGLLMGSNQLQYCWKADLAAAGIKAPW